MTRHNVQEVCYLDYTTSQTFRFNNPIQLLQTENENVTIIPILKHLLLIKYLYKHYFHTLLYFKSER